MRTNSIWDLYGLFDKADKNSGKYAIAEAVAQSEQRLIDKYQENGLEIPKREEQEFNIDDVQPTEAEKTAREVVKGGIQGWFFDVPENILNSVEEYKPGFLPKKKLIFNIPGLKNYDKNKDTVFLMDDEEFNQLKDEKKISYMPQLLDEQTVAGDFTRTIAKTLRGIRMANPVAKQVSSVFPKSARKTTEVLTEGVIGSQLAFNPYEERISNMVNEVIEDTPAEVLKPFFDWMQADDDNSEIEERFKMALESVVTDVAFLGAFRLYKGRRDILKAVVGNKSPDEIAEIQAKAMARMDKKANKSELPVSSKDYNGTAPATKVLQAKLEDPTIFASPTTAKRVVEDLVNSDFRDVNPTGYRVFNTKYLEDEGASEALNMFETLIRKEMSRRVEGLDVPKGPKTLTEIQEAGLKLSDTIQGQRIINVTEDTATQLGVDRDLLMEMMMKDLNDLAGLEARTLAYRGVISQYGAELQQIRKDLANKPGDPLLEARFLDLVAQTEDALRVFGEVRRIPARTVTAQRIKVPKSMETAKPQEIKDLYDALRETGMDTRKIQLFAETLGLAKGPLHTVRIAELGAESMVRKGFRGLLEFYRSMLLTSLKTHITNTVSGFAETFAVPVTRLVGGTLMRDKEVIKETGSHFVGLLYGFRESTSKMIEAIRHERNILDPMGTKVDGLVSPHSNAIAMENLAPDKPWSPYSWLSSAVNNFGKLSRMSIRLLGGEDEFFKQLNYRAQAYSKIVKNIPDGMNRQQRKDFIAKAMDDYFDEVGRATDNDLLNYAQKITFTEDLRPGSPSAYVQNLAHKFPPFQFIMPFIRTPVNIFERFKQRTPILNHFFRSHREMMQSTDPAIRAQAIGNTALGVALYGTAVSYIMDGTVTGGGPVDPDLNKIWRQAGNQPYSIKTPSGNWVSYNRLDPMFMPFVFLTTIHENANVFIEDPSDYQDRVTAGVLAFAKAATDRTYLQGLDAVFKTFANISTGNTDRAMDPLAQLALNVIPPVINQQYDIGQSFGLYGGAEGFREAISWNEKFMRKAPQLTGYNAIKHSWLTGKPIVSPFGYNTGIPVSTEQANKYLMEVVRMGRSIDPPDIRIGNVEMTGPQYAELNKIIGNVEIQGMTLMDALAAFMESENYNFDPNRHYNPDYPDFRIEGVRSIIRTYKDMGRKMLMSQDSGLMNSYIQDRVNAGMVLQGGEPLFELNLR